MKRKEVKLKKSDLKYMRLKQAKQLPEINEDLQFTSKITNTIFNHVKEKVINNLAMR